MSGTGHDSEREREVGDPGDGDLIAVLHKRRRYPLEAECWGRNKNNLLMVTYHRGGRRYSIPDDRVLGVLKTFA